MSNENSVEITPEQLKIKIDNIDLSVEDLFNILKIISSSSEKGLFKPDEFVTIGHLNENLKKSIIKLIE